jgi:hypothetical protein
LKCSCAFRLLLLILLATSFAIAQSTDGTISGLVVDTSGRVLTGADIEILNDATGAHYASKTNGAGIYTVSILPPSRYRVQVSKIGFKTLIKPDVILNVQSALALNFTLPVGAVSESITVEAGSFLINTTDASVSTVIDKKFVENIPLNGRSFQDLISMTPGVTTQSPQVSSSVGSNGDFSVNGQRTESNYYMVDGVTGNVGAGNGFGSGQAGNGVVSAATALGTTQSLISVDALQEFRVQSSSYSAEYGHSPGGQFSLATRSGTNEFHGSAFDYIRNNFFDANDWFNDHFGKPITALRQNDFGGTLGGPILIPGLYDGRGKSFFFGSYEGLRLTQPQAASIQYVPDSFMRQQAPAALQSALNAFPIQNGVDYGSAISPSLAQFIAPSSLPSNIDSSSVRIDDLTTPKLHIFFRFGDTPSSTSARTLSAQTRTSQNTRTYTVGTTSQLSTTVANEFRAGYSQSSSSVTGSLDSFGGATSADLPLAFGIDSIANAEPVMELLFPGIGTSTLTLPNSGNKLHQWNLNDIFTLQLGHHTLRYGFDYRRLSSTLSPTGLEGEGIFETSQSVLKNQATILALLKFISATPIFNDTSAFVQDEWHASSTVNLSLGLRWEAAPPPSGANGNDAYTLQGSLADPVSLTLAPQGTSLWQAGWYNFAPRLGVAWTAHDNPGSETVVRGGGGVFFDSANKIATQGYSGIGFQAFKLYSGAPLPVTTAQLNFQPSTTAPYTSSTVYAFPSQLQLPYTIQWNVSLEQALGRSQALTLSYVGANGRRLLAEQQMSLSSLNSSFGTIEYFLNNLTSSYEALEMKFQRSVAHGLQALGSYTWAHSIDFGSSGAALPVMRGNSDFDVRNNFQAGASWEIPGSKGKMTGLFVNGWGIDARAMSRTAFPVTLNGNFLTDPATGTQYYGNLNLIVGQPIYLFGPQFPGGRAINRAALTLPAIGSGNAPRNFVRGFGATQINLATRRNFPIHDSIALQFRAEAFNLLNHPTFGYIDPTYGDLTFGQATKMLNQSLGTVAAQYQQGGPRSMQFSLKLVF